jgi:hypothetical protein
VLHALAAAISSMVRSRSIRDMEPPPASVPTGPRG